MNIEAVIPAAPKDYNKIAYVIRSISNYAQDIKAVHVISPDMHGFVQMGNLPITCHVDEDVLYFDRRKFTYRPNWIYQQFLKLFQNVTSTEWFVVVDADILFNTDLKFFDKDKPIMMLGRDQNHPPYYRYNQAMLGLGRVYDHSFLSECTLYNKSLVTRMIEHAGFSIPIDFIEKSATIITSDCYPAESELYGNFIAQEYPNLYKYRHLCSSMQGRYSGHIWTEREIEDLISEMAKRHEVDIFSMHTWEGTP